MVHCMKTDGWIFTPFKIWKEYFLLNIKEKNFNIHCDIV